MGSGRQRRYARNGFTCAAKRLCAAALSVSLVAGPVPAPAMAEMRDEATAAIAVGTAMRTTPLNDQACGASVLVALHDGNVMVVDEGAPYQVVLSFAERPDLGFDEEAELVYVLPPEFRPADEQPSPSQPVTLRYTGPEGVACELAATDHAARLSEGTLGLRLGEGAGGDAVAQAIAEADDASFEISLSGAFAAGSTSVSFCDVPTALSVLHLTSGINEIAVDESNVGSMTEPEPGFREDGPGGNGGEEAGAEETSLELSGELAEDPEETRSNEGELAEADRQPTRTEYSYDDARVRVVATADPDALPDEAELSVTEVVRETAGYDYDSYLDALNEATGADHTDENTILYDVCFVLDGSEVEPTGEVSISFDFLNRQLEEGIEAGTLGEVDVSHLREREDGIVPENVEAEVSVKGEQASFATDSFSVFAFSYTFEFEVGGYSYELPGMDAVSLSELMLSLGIAGGVSNVRDVTFSDPSLVSVAKVGNGPDWTIARLAHFDTLEAITVTMTTGVRYVITVSERSLAITRNPNNVSATEGQTARFSVSAAGAGLSHR